jgi:pseudouridine kinase
VQPPQVIVVGAANVDTKGRPGKALAPGTSNPSDLRISVGGVGRNIAESLARLGVHITLLSAVGGGGSAEESPDLAEGANISRSIPCQPA